MINIIRDLLLLLLLLMSKIQTDRLTYKNCPKLIEGSDNCICYKRMAICRVDPGLNNNSDLSPPPLDHFMDDVTYSGYDIDSSSDKARFGRHSNVVVKNAQHVHLKSSFGKQFTEDESLLKRLSFLDCQRVTVDDKSFSGIQLSSLEFSDIALLDLQIKAFDGLGISRLLRITNSSVNKRLMPRQFRLLCNNSIYRYNFINYDKIDSIRHSNLFFILNYY